MCAARPRWPWGEWAVKPVTLFGDDTGHQMGSIETAGDVDVFRFTAPATGALTKARGISGTLSRLKRVRGGFTQLMLNGHPVYRYNGDSSKGQGNGEGIRSFGGTWHVVTP